MMRKGGAAIHDTTQIGFLVTILTVITSKEGRGLDRTRKGL